MISAVFDTNVLASGFVGAAIERSTPGQLMRLWYGRAFELIASQPILVEFARTLEKPYFASRLSPEERHQDAALVREEATVVPITTEVVGVIDEDDDLVLATALSAKADYLVTGDQALQALREYRGVTIVSPSAFLEILRRRVDR